MQKEAIKRDVALSKQLYKALLKPRMIEEKMLILLRQGRVSKWFSGIGQEAVSVGAAMAMGKEEIIFPMHRNLGVFTCREVPLQNLFAQFQGKKSGFTKGRDRSFHFGTMDHNIVGMISHLGPQLSVANGVALADQLKQVKSVTLAFTGDGATSEGEFHEAMNVAAVWQLPVIFVIENNGYGLSTPSREQFRCEQIIDKAIGYGMRGVKIDGNNVEEVYNTVKQLRAELLEKPEPVMLEAMTFRMRGHEEASGTAYVPNELMEAWAKKDPVENYEKALLKEGVLSTGEVEQIRKEIKQEINEAWEEAFKEEFATADVSEELEDVYAPFSPLANNATGASKEIRFVDAITEGLDEAMQKFPELVLMGQDIAEYGGVFKITKGFTEKYGEGRVRNTPLCESAILGAAMGLSLRGMKAMVEMQFADFVSCGFNQIVNYLAKVNYRWGQNADVVVRMPTGAGVGAGPFHSQSNEAWFFHVPGLKIVYPSTPAEAKGLLLAAFEDPNPVMFFEHKALYRALSGEVPEGYYTTPIGEAKIVQQGEDVTIITYGMAVQWSVEAAIKAGNSVEVIDLRSLLPWDKKTVASSVKKTGKVLICHEDTLSGGIGGEIAAWISENCFEWLDAPVMREASLDTPVPFNKNLEEAFLPVQRIEEKLKKLLEY